MKTSTSERVPASTPESVNQKIRQQTCANLARYGRDRSAITERLVQLDREWDVERLTMLSATVDAFATLGLGLWRGRRWLVGGLALLGGALLAHTLVGQCPSLPLYRRLGVRTREEIDYERYALKVRRGDFENLDAADDRRLLAAMRA